MKKILVCLLITLCTVVSFSGCGDDEEIEISGSLKEKDCNASDTDVSSSETTEGVSGSGEDNDSVFVYLVGAVNKPGVYEVPPGTRLFRVVDSAGGLREDAAADALNLAATVQDGSVIRVPDLKEYEAGGTPVSLKESSGGQMCENSSGGLININTASAAELATLNGIGESRAEAIISYREENGYFGCIEDIKKVSGIKDGLFNKIRDKITV